MSTTFQTIRAQQVALIEAIMPARMATKRFSRHRDRLPITPWIEQNPTSAFRRFDVRMTLDLEQMPTSDGNLALWRHGVDVVVGYPRQDTDRDRDDLLTSDLGQIDKAIGLYGGSDYSAGLDLCEFRGSSLDESEAAHVLVISFVVQYTRSV